MDMKEVMKGCKNKLERIAFLKDNCNKVIEKSYSKNFTPAELQQYKEKLVEVCDKIDALEDKKKSTIKEFKLEIDPLQSKRKEMIGNIRSKAKLVTEVATCSPMPTPEQRHSTMTMVIWSRQDKQPRMNFKRICSRKVTCAPLAEHIWKPPEQKASNRVKR